MLVECKEFKNLSWYVLNIYTYTPSNHAKIHKWKNEIIFPSQASTSESVLSIIVGHFASLRLFVLWFDIDAEPWESTTDSISLRAEAVSYWALYLA